MERRGEVAIRRRVDAVGDNARKPQVFRERDDVDVYATDVSSDALAVARANLAGIGRRGRSVTVCEGAWFAALPPELKGRLDVIVSNPPYIAEGDARVDDSVRAWEPQGALYSGTDGLDDLRAIASGAAEWLRPGGWLVS